MEQLTDIQRRVFEFVRHIRASGRSSPTAREIAAKFGWRSKRAAECHIRALIRKGWLRSEPGKARSLQLIEPANYIPSIVVEVPLFGSISAGFGDEERQAFGHSVNVTADSLGFTPTLNTFALKVEGDSMIGMQIRNGDIAFFDRGHTPRSGQIVAALIDRKSTLKTFVIKEGKPYLRAENPMFPELIPSQELVIQGIFRALIRQSKD